VTQGYGVRPEAFIYPAEEEDAEEEQLEPFRKVLEGSAGASEIATSCMIESM
jgi:hypothetical protein